MMVDCIFCKIVKGEMPCFKVWEDDSHLAFLSPFGNTPGFTVVITKDHHSSYVFDLPDDVFVGLMTASRKVGRLIDSKLEDVGRTGLLAEGFGINHVHTKLFPMHGTADMKEWKPIENKQTTFFDQYPGYLSSHDVEKRPDAELDKVAKKIRG